MHNKAVKCKMVSITTIGRTKTHSVAKADQLMTLRGQLEQQLTQFYCDVEKLMEATVKTLAAYIF